MDVITAHGVRAQLFFSTGDIFMVAIMKKSFWKITA